MITLKYLVLGQTYFGFDLGYLPGRRMNQPAVAIIGSDECGGFWGYSTWKLLERRSTPVRCFVLGM